MPSLETKCQVLRDSPLLVGITSELRGNLSNNRIVFICHQVRVVSCRAVPCYPQLSQLSHVMACWPGCCLLWGCRNKSFQCSQRMPWIHKTCSGITNRLVADPNYVCRGSNGEARSMDGKTVKGLSMAPRLMWRPHSATYLTWCVQVLWQCRCCQMLCGLGGKLANLLLC